MNDSSPAAQHRVGTRELTPAERRELSAGPPSTWSGTTLIFFVWGVFPSLLLGWLGRWLGGMEWFDAPALGQRLGWSLGLTLFLALWFSTRRSSRALERLVESDLKRGLVQVVAARGARFLTPEHPISEPQLVVELGDGAALCLQGGWLNEGPRFGRSEPDSESNWDDSHFNGLPEPWAFPSPAFTLHRLPSSGRVLRVEVQGSYVEPTPADDPQFLTYRTKDSEWLGESSDKA